MPSQREQYGGTVHLFIGTGHNSCKITSMPFTFGSNSIVIHRGLNSLFIFKSVSFSAITPKLSCSQLRRCVNLRILWASPCGTDSSPKILVHTLYSRNIIKSCFEDLRKPKAPNTILCLSICIATNRSEITRNLKYQWRSTWSCTKKASYDLDHFLYLIMFLIFTVICSG
jgi:hypothetical protein